MTLSIGAMDVKVMHGEVVVESIPFESLVSWEAVGDTFSLVAPSCFGPKKAVPIGFGAVNATDICEALLASTTQESQAAPASYNLNLEEQERVMVAMEMVHAFLHSSSCTCLLCICCEKSAVLFQFCF